MLFTFQLAQSESITAGKTRTIDEILGDISKKQLPEFQAVFDALVKKLGYVVPDSGEPSTSAPTGTTAGTPTAAPKKLLPPTTKERIEKYNWELYENGGNAPRGGKHGGGGGKFGLATYYRDYRNNELSKAEKTTTNNVSTTNDTKNYYVGGVNVTKERLGSLSALDALDNLALFVNTTMF